MNSTPRARTQTKTATCAATILLVTLLSFLGADRAGAAELRRETVGLAVERQANGRILVGGFSQRCAGWGVSLCPASAELFVARFTRSGLLDHSFAGDGVAVIPLSVNASSLAGMALQPDGKIVVASGGISALSAESMAARLTVQGKLDPTFGTAGLTTIDPNRFHAGAANALALAADGSIIVAGSAPDPAGERLAAARLGPNGVLDTSFGSAGIASLRADPQAERENANAVVVRSDGRIVLAGASGPQSLGPVARQGSFVAAQLTPAGMPDPTFGNDGRATIGSLTASDSVRVGARSLALLADGGLLLAGSRAGGPRACPQITVAGLTATGQPDADFGAGGLSTAPTKKCAPGFDLTVTDVGQALVTAASLGESFRDGGFGYVNLALFGASGEPDLGFGSSGIQSFRPRRLPGGLYALEESPRRRTYAAGYVISDHCAWGRKSKAKPCRALALMRLSANGRLDRGFAERGLATLPPVCRRATAEPCM